MDATVYGYAFDNGSHHAREHHMALSDLLDTLSSERIGRLLDLADRRVLEVAAGGGGLARWLATQVWPTGTVLATDIQPLAIESHPRLHVIRHDITTDPVPQAGTWDLIHARLLLNHLPQRRAVLAKLAGALAPGGVLLTEDWVSEPPGRFVASAPQLQDMLLLRAYHTAVLAVLDAHGNDRQWATEAHAAMREEGLNPVQTVVSANSWPGGSVGARLLAATLAQLRRDLINIGGLEPAQLDRVQELFTDPAVTFHGHRLYSTSGVKRAT